MLPFRARGWPMADLKDAIKLIFGLAAVAAGVWGFVHSLAFLKERGIRLGRYDASHEPAKVEIQTLFHGNTKDEDQI